MKTLERRFVRMFGCDSARVVNFPGDRMFLILGHKRHTKDDAGQWFKNDEPFDFEYLEEKVIANGRTESELIQSARTYKRLLETA